MNKSTNPDSVSLVKPPKTTIPKTLAALPSSQYATILSLTSGKRGRLLEVAPMFLLKLAKGEEAIPSTLLADDEADGLTVNARENVELIVCDHLLVCCLG